MNSIKTIINTEIENNMGIVGITDSFFCVYLLNLLEKYNKNILVVVNDISQANILYSNISNMSDNVYLFPMDDFLTSEAIAVSPELVINRLDTLNSIVSHNSSIVITNLMGYLRFLPKKETFINSIINLKVGDEINLIELREKLVKLGYVSDSIVNKTGEIAARGFIVDIYPLDYDNPVRIEFFGDEIDSIRLFDPVTQISINSINEVNIKPIIEFITDKMIEENHFNRQKYLPLYEGVNSLLDYLDDPITIYKDYEQLLINYKSIIKQADELRNEKDIHFKDNYFIDFNKLNPKILLYYMSINNISTTIKDINDYKVKTVPSFYENIISIEKYFIDYLNDNYTIFVFIKDYQIKSLVKKINVPYNLIEKDNLSFKQNTVNLVNCELDSGFIYDKYVFITGKELFNEKVIKHKYKNKFKYTSSIKDLSKLNVGDFVVHDLYGVGIYKGITSLKSFDTIKDYIEIVYANNDKIYVPVEKISSLFKYTGREGLNPKINSLNTKDWIKTKNRVANRVHDMATELIKLYAERNSRKGFAFSKDNELLSDFEKEFPYVLTDDQSKAIADIKNDMESNSPMDRLLCGDVGFGKTEVAFVAAFKAVLDSKQVLFLCPTTILSNQHYENAINRFKDFPVNIGNLNRFTSPSETRRIINGLKDGTMDIVFGTHRILSNDIQPKNLGLLIIDEEQRFGVKHKEVIKQYKSNVDVLTLTATPIPRTLQMSLTGIRSLSLIETPPVNRYPVQTYVIEENDTLIKDAINKEIARGGQVFVLYNRVESIEYEKEKLMKLVPNAKICIGHGQLTKNELENTIEDFVNEKYNVLLCSTIIETGIDIPNVNTLIVIDADRFGLSQLYQIRGRVGRSDKFAYAYFMYKPYKKLTDSAIKRLNVIKEFTELGSGFSIASRDLTIRGAGDILGSEQAGFIDNIGIDLYMKMLNDEVSNIENNDLSIQKEEVNEEINPVTLKSVSTHISDSMAMEDDVKIEIHKLINNVIDKDSFNNIKNILEDRFGKLSDDTLVYMHSKWFENVCDQLNITNIHETNNFTEIVLKKDLVSQLNIEDLFVEVVKLSNRFKFMSRGTDIVISLNTIRIDKHPIYYLLDLVNSVLKIKKEGVDSE